MTEAVTGADAADAPHTDPDPITNPEPIRTPGGRVVAPGGWRRAVTGIAVGVVAGAVHRLARGLDEARGTPDDLRGSWGRDTRR
ncbi:hypothetical protein [Salsipaludibacter albus]|uniref:hypothetical protein n=1 Tax=Salsipaludibacter albus TaxID=2849650 RepID=UPI001EE3CADF|nr:hypothetical protein [Salsipaludibacter albus]MBY5161242.1 hypothetical protein [Salsipaludibacter albus]